MKYGYARTQHMEDQTARKAVPLCEVSNDRVNSIRKLHRCLWILPKFVAVKYAGGIDGNVSHGGNLTPRFFREQSVAAYANSDRRAGQIPIRSTLATLTSSLHRSFRPVVFAFG